MKAYFLNVSARIKRSQNRYQGTENVVEITDICICIYAYMCLLMCQFIVMILDVERTEAFLFTAIYQNMRFLSIM